MNNALRFFLIAVSAMVLGACKQEDRDTSHMATQEVSNVAKARAGVSALGGSGQGVERHLKDVEKRNDQRNDKMMRMMDDVD